MDSLETKQNIFFPTYKGKIVEDGVENPPSPPSLLVSEKQRCETLSGLLSSVLTEVCILGHSFKFKYIQLSS